MPKHRLIECHYLTEKIINRVNPKRKAEYISKIAADTNSSESYARMIVANRLREVARERRAYLKRLVLVCTGLEQWNGGCDNSPVTISMLCLTASRYARAAEGRDSVPKLTPWYDEQAREVHWQLDDFWELEELLPAGFRFGQVVHFDKKTLQLTTKVTFE